MKAAYYKTDRFKAQRQAYRQSERGKAGEFASRLKRVYGLSLDTYLEMVITQEGRCAACSKVMEYGGQGPKSCCVDHDHSKVKGDEG